MDSQIVYPHEQEAHNVGQHPVAEGEEHEKKSVLKKVKAKAKKIKETLIHGHGHGPSNIPDDHDLDEEDDDDDEEMLDAPAQIHGKLPSAAGKEGLEVGVGKTGNIKEVPYSPLNTPGSTTPGTLEHTDPVDTFTRQPQGILDRPIGLEDDPHAPKDRPEHHVPSNYQSKVPDPTGTGKQELGVSPILHSFDKMSIYSEQKLGAEENVLPRAQDESVFPTESHDQFSPEPTPPIPISTQESSHPISGTTDDASNSKQGGYAEKISSATSAIADKARSATNVVVSKLGYNSAKEHGGGEEHKAKPTSSSPVEYGKKIAATVTEKLTPVYDKVAETGSTVMSKVSGIHHGTTGTGNEGERDVRGQYKGVSVKEYFSDKLRPGDEDRALSEVISESLNRKKQEPTEKPIGKVTESEEVKRRLGSNEENLGEREDQSAVRVPGGVMVDKVKGVVGSMFGKRVETQGSPASYTGNVRNSDSASGEETGERRLQESGN